MSAFWKRWIGKTVRQPHSSTLLDYAENYLYVFAIGSDDEKSRHAAKLFEAANATARHVGAGDFFSLIKTSDIEALGQATIYSRRRFEEITTPDKGGYWSSAYGLTHLMLLNYVKSFEDEPRAKQVAENAAHLYSAEYAKHKLLGD